jgi:hypothetical protein
MPEKKEIIKIQPYPFDCTLAKVSNAPGAPASAALVGQVLRIEDHGLVLKTSLHYFKISDAYMIDFEIPFFKHQVTEEVKVIKTRESSEYVANDPKLHKVMTIEMHFKTLSPESKNVIRNFLAKIGQKRVA